MVVTLLSIAFILSLKELRIVCTSDALGTSLKSSLILGAASVSEAFQIVSILFAQVAFLTRPYCSVVVALVATSIICLSVLK